MSRLFIALGATLIASEVLRLLGIDEWGVGYLSACAAIAAVEEVERRINPTPGKR